MKVVKDLNELNKVLINIVKEVVDEVGEKVNQLMKEHVDSDVYRKGFRTNSYAYGTSQPTYGLRDSITTTNSNINGNEVSTKIYHDKNKMIFDPDNFVHGSRYWKDGTTDIRDILPEIVTFGLSGDLFGSGWWQDERPYYQNTLKDLKDKGLLRKWFIEGLKAKGIDVR